MQLVKGIFLGDTHCAMLRISPQEVGWPVFHSKDHQPPWTSPLGSEETGYKKEVTKYLCCCCLSSFLPILLTPPVDPQSEKTPQVHKSKKDQPTNMQNFLVAPKNALPSGLDGPYSQTAAADPGPLGTPTLKETGWPQSSFSKLADQGVLGLEV